MYLEPLDKKYLRELHGIIQIAEPYGDSANYADFLHNMKDRTGFVVCKTDGTLIGSITFSNYVPKVDLLLHVSVLPIYHGRWINRAILRQGFAYPFCNLELPRLSGFCINGVTDQAGATLASLGFKQEGTIRKGTLANGKYYDISIYGMLREECKWLRQ